MEPASSGIVGWLSNLDVGWILMTVAVLTMVRYNALKSDSVRLQALSEYVESIIVAGVVVFMIVRPFAVQAFFIPSPSMEPTLLGEHGSGDRILVNKFGYRVSKPQRDDVVVFIPPSYAATNDPGVTDDDGVPVDENGIPVDFIKRLIALPGDTIEAHAGIIFINGTPYNHMDVRMAFAKEGLFGPNCPSDPQDILAEHHVKFTKQGVQVDGPSNVVPPAKLSSLLAGIPNAVVKVVPGYVTLNGVTLNEPFTAEDPDYDCKMYNGQPLKAHYPFAPYFKNQYTLGVTPIDKATYDVDSHSPAGQIPAGQYFMMGDNRNDSEDGTEWGTLDANRVIGRAQFIFWPLNRFGIIH